MSAFDLLETIGKVKIGTKIKVKETLNKDWHNGSFTLYPGCEVIVTNAFGENGVYGIADLGGRLQKVMFNVEEYHLLELAEETEHGE